MKKTEMNLMTKFLRRMCGTVLMQHCQKRNCKFFSIKDIYKWSAAAAVFFILLTSAYFLWIHKPIVIEPAIVSAAKPDTIYANKTSFEEQILDSSASLVNEITAAPDKRDLAGMQADVKTSKGNDIFKIIEAKQAQLKSLTKEQPYLYQQFSADLRTLESSYGVLKSQMKQTPNRDVIIKAMMQNLQLQAELLGRQLTIMNDIKTNKTNEKVNTRNM
ncbi:MAG: hypothetical protein IPP48_03050 [Chitinophagaceae bacterium]|nr:hypothetical protein [Chitinophagaceae bacterium]